MKRFFLISICLVFMTGCYVRLYQKPPFEERATPEDLTGSFWDKWRAKLEKEGPGNEQGPALAGRDPGTTGAASVAGFPAGGSPPGEGGDGNGDKGDGNASDKGDNDSGKGKGGDKGKGCDSSKGKGRDHGSKGKDNGKGTGSDHSKGKGKGHGSDGKGKGKGHDGRCRK